MAKKDDNFSILIVDDNIEIRTILEEYLRKRAAPPTGQGTGKKRS